MTGANAIRGASGPSKEANLAGINPRGLAAAPVLTT